MNQGFSELSDCVLVLAADDGYAMPLAVTVRSVLDHVGSDQMPLLYILDGGLTPASKERLHRSWPELSRDRIRWIKVDEASTREFPAVGHLTAATNYRLLLSELLPTHVARVIYLDADLVCEVDIRRLWMHPLEGKIAAAACDVGAPYFDSDCMLKNASRCVPLLAAARPIRNYRELQLPAESQYFNAGVMLIDMRLWRESGVSAKCLDCVRQNKDMVLWADQYTLNVVLTGQWTPIDIRWNQGSHIFQFPKWNDSPFDEKTYEEIRTDPYFIHFSAPIKPWHWNCSHPFRSHFYRYLDRTDWKGWRPSTPPIMSRVIGGGSRVIRESVRRLKARGAIRRAARMVRESGRAMKRLFDKFTGRVLQ